MGVIENEIKNRRGDQGSLSRRNDGFYPFILKQYYPRAYGIVKSGCDINNPHLYRPAPGGGYYPPASSAFYKREEGVDHDVDAVTENAKIIQKELAIEWENLSSSGVDNSLSRRAFITNGLGDAAQYAAQSAAQAMARSSANGYGRQVVQASHGYVPKIDYEAYVAAASHNMRNYHHQAYSGAQNMPNIDYPAYAAARLEDQGQAAGQLSRQEVRAPSDADGASGASSHSVDENAGKSQSVDENARNAAMQKKWRDIAGAVGVFLLTSAMVFWLLRVLIVYQVPQLRNMTKND
jgi:hypothetical protein